MKIPTIRLVLLMTLLISLGVRQQSIVERTQIDHQHDMAASIIGLVRIITLWQEGKVGGFVRGADAIGLQAIHVPQDVDVGARDTPSATRDLTPLEAAAYLKIGVGAIRALRDAGYFGHAKRLNVDTNHRHSLITKSSIREFEARFLTLGQLATSAQVAPIHLARQLDREGVPTVTCRGRHVRAYERSKIAEHELVARRISVG